MVEVTSGMHLQGQIIVGGRGSRIGAGLQEEELKAVGRLPRGSQGHRQSKRHFPLRAISRWEIYLSKKPSHDTALYFAP